MAAVSSQELKVDVVSTPEVCDQKSKNGDTVSVTVVYVCMYMFQLRFDPIQILEREKKEMWIHYVNLTSVNFNRQIDEVISNKKLDRPVRY